MTRAGIDKAAIIKNAAQLVNQAGMEQITMKMLADKLGIKPPSLYNHIKGLEDLKKQLMIFGWTQAKEKLLLSLAGVSGYDAIKAMCYAFYDYATENTGLFEVMLWYNKFENEEAAEATAELLAVIFRITRSLDIPDNYGFHLIRTFRGFLEGFFLLVNNGSFGHPLPITDSFEISVNILIAGIKELAHEWRDSESEKLPGEKEQ